MPSRRPARRTWTILPLLIALLASLAVVLATPADATELARKPKPKPAPTVPGQPPRNYVVPQGSVFAFPNRSKAESRAIRNRVLFTVGSVWGAAGREPGVGTPLPGGGTIRMATWSFDDWAMARALVNAKKRGVSVQVVAAAGKNKEHASWQWLRQKLGKRPYPVGRPDLADRSSFARICRGSCRGPGGTAHAKYFLFDNVGAAHARNVVMNTSMNLTQFAFTNQWNHATTWHDSRVYADYLQVFREARMQVRAGYHAKYISGVSDYFFPYPGMQPVQDPVLRWLGPVVCTGAGAGGNAWGYTKIRVLQYAMYGDRGVYIAKRLRQLWNVGCDVAIIYSVASRPVLKILRNKSGRGPIPMRQSVIANSRNEIEKYNHSKWMTISGHWGTDPGKFIVMTGSANWANLAVSSDEQMQIIQSPTWTTPFLAAFDKTWRQKSSKRPGGSAHMVEGRLAGTDTMVRQAPAGDPQFGKGIYRFLEQD